MIIGTVFSFAKKLFGKKSRPPPKGCLGLVATQACYGKSTLSKLFEMANDILKTPGQRMIERWEEMVYGMNGTFGSGPCGSICMSLDETVNEISEARSVFVDVEFLSDGHPILEKILRIADKSKREGAAIAAGKNVNAALNSLSNSPDTLISLIWNIPADDAGMLRIKIFSVLHPLAIDLARTTGRDIGQGGSAGAGATNEVASGIARDHGARSLGRALGIAGKVVDLAATLDWSTSEESFIECGPSFGPYICGNATPP